MGNLTISNNIISYLLYLPSWETLIPDVHSQVDKMNTSKCIKQFVVIVISLAKFHSNQMAVSLCFVVIVSEIITLLLRAAVELTVGVLRKDHMRIDLSTELQARLRCLIIQNNSAL